jgi:hypothetical protein
MPTIGKARSWSRGAGAVRLASVIDAGRLDLGAEVEPTGSGAEAPFSGFCGAPPRERGAFRFPTRFDSRLPMARPT